MTHETETSPRAGRRVTRRRAVAAALGASGLLAAIGIAQLQGASAEPIDSDIAAVCALGTSTVDVTVPLTVDDKIDPVTEGGHSTLETRTGLPTLPVEVTIDKLVVTTPIPTQIASTDAVTFGPGNVTPSYEVVGSDLVVTFTGPVSSSQIQVPTVTAEQTVASGSGSATIDWKPFSQIDADTNYGVATCTPNEPDQIVNSTTITATTPTTEPTAPPSTEPPSTEPTTPPSTEPPSTEPTTPPTTEPPSTPPTTTSPAKPAPPTVPGVPTPPVPVPTAPSLPAPPSLPALPSPPSVPSLPPPGEPCPATGLPPLPLIGCPNPPAVPVPDPDVDADIDIDVDLTIGL